MAFASLAARVGAAVVASVVASVVAVVASVVATVDASVVAAAAVVASVVVVASSAKTDLFAWNAVNKTPQDEIAKISFPILRIDCSFFIQSFLHKHFS